MPPRAAQEPTAVIGRAKPAAAVAARDFHVARRLSAARVAELARTLENALPQLEKKLNAASGLPLALSLAGIGEVDAGQLFAGASEPLCVLRFRVERDAAWLAWDPAAAVGVLEAVLGTRSGAPNTARKLSPVETKVASQLLGELARGVAGALGLAAADPVLVQLASELGSWRDAGEGAEPHRVAVRLRVARAGVESELALYLPRIGPGAASAAELPLPKELPAHLQRVEVELSAELTGCEISLDQLLALEQGDVIPLDARLGDPAALRVEGLTLAAARLGSHRGRLAVRIERLEVVPESLA